MPTTHRFLVIRNVTVIDGTGRAPISGVDVTVGGGLIVSIEPCGSRAAPDAIILDGKGGYLLPGLWEGHTHLRSPNGSTFAVQLERLQSALANYSKCGITSVLELGGPLDVNLMVRSQDSFESGAYLYFAGPAFTGVGGWPLDLHHNHALVCETDDPRAAQAEVASLSEHVDFVKCIYDGKPGAPDKLSRAALGAIVEAAHEHGKRVLVHIRTKADIEDAVAAGADGIEHVFIPQDFDDLDEAVDVAALLAENGTYFCPTLVAFEQIGRSSDPHYFEELQRDGILTAEEARAASGSPMFGGSFPHHPTNESLHRFEYGLQTLSIMLQAGVKLAAGSDVAVFMSRPAALFRELQLLQRAGLSPNDVIIAATRHSAEKIGGKPLAATLVPGASADAILLDADPLEDLRFLTTPGHRIATICNGVIIAQ